jgi:uncharacterized protein (TIGR02145 family)
MKSTSGWASGGNGTNSSGFNTLPAGNRNLDGTFGSLTSLTHIWSSDLYNSSTSYQRKLNYVENRIEMYWYDKLYGFSVRCLKDTTNQSPAEPSNPSPSNNSTNQSINSQLSWTCTDPENDPLTFDVYFGTTNPPALVSSGQTGSNFNPGILLYNTPYYWKIVARDDHSNATEGPVWTFTTIVQLPWECGDPLFDTRDSQTYATVQIGTQCWMAENLNVGTMVTGSIQMTDNGIIEKYCYANYTANCDINGGLYQWNEAMQYVTNEGSQGICQIGWHLPSDAEWSTLTDYVNNQPSYQCNSIPYYIAKAMAATTLWNSSGNTCAIGNNLSLNNATGFSALPGGWRFFYGSDFGGGGYEGFFWSSTEYDPDGVWYRYLSHSNGQVFRFGDQKSYGISVRCLKDN